MLDTLKNAFASKKFLAAIIGVVVVAAGTAFGLSEDQSMKIVALICTYVLGQGVADHGKEKAKELGKLSGDLAGKTAAEKAAALESEA
jgi:hypothetical protein